MRGRVAGVAQSALIWLETTLGAIAAINALAHVLGALPTRSHCPGFCATLALWASLGLLSLRQRLLGLASGVLAHARLTLAALSL